MPHAFVAGLSESTPRPAAAPAKSLISSSVRVRVPIVTEADVALASEQGRKLASRLAFSPTDLTVIATAISEVARNILQYAERGDILLHLIRKPNSQGLAIVVHDRGPGIRDVEQAIRDGKGLGLATTRRLMDEFRIRSEPGRGTTITMRKWTTCRQVERAGARSRGHAGMREVR
jgi:serine/threonine-protein kinase RsbT